MKQLAWYTAVVLLTLASIVLLYEFREAVFLFFLSLALAAVFRPLIQRLKKRGFPQVAAVLLPYFIAISILVGLIFLSWGPLTKEIQLATDDLAVAYNRILNRWPNGSPFQQALVEQLPPVADLSTAVTGEQGEALLPGVIGLASNLIGVVSSIAIILALSMYWSADRIYFERFWLSILPVHQRTRARDAWRDIEAGVGDYLRSEITQFLIALILLRLLYPLVGIEFPTLLALLGGIAWLIPWAGAILAILPAFLIGLSVNLGVAISAALVTLVVLVFLEFVVERRMVKKRTYDSLLVVLMLIVMVDVFGLVGVFIAPFLSAIIQSAGRRLWIKPKEESRAKPDVEITRLRARLTEMQETVENIVEPAPHIVNLIGRIDKIIEQTEGVLQDRYH
jgi:putative permease